MIDALVVGGGPAGSTLALRLARAGVGVAVLERRRFPRAKVCGGYLSVGAINALGDLGVLDRVSVVAHPIRFISLAGFGIGPLCWRIPNGGALSIDRAALDAILLDCAASCGARIVHGSFVTATQFEDRVLVEYRQGDGTTARLDTRVLVAADGAWSSVAQRAGLAPRVRKCGRWAVGGYLRGQPQSDELEMHVGRNGYYARNPLAGGTTNSMLVMPMPTPESEADDVVAQITCGRHRFERNAIEKRVAIGPLWYRPKRVSLGRVLLTGDAGGFVEPFTGQGMAIATQLSLPAANAVREILAGVALREAGARYRAAHRSLVAPRRMLGALVEALVRIPALRSRALRNVARRPHVAEAVFAAIAGAAPARTALSVGRLWSLVA